MDELRAKVSLAFANVDGFFGARLLEGNVVYVFADADMLDAEGVPPEKVLETCKEIVQDIPELAENMPVFWVRRLHAETPITLMSGILNGLQGVIGVKIAPVGNKIGIAVNYDGGKIEEEEIKKNVLTTIAAVRKTTGVYFQAGVALTKYNEVPKITI